MRHIKFRGLEIGSNKWYYGDLKVFEGVNIGYSFETCHFDEGKVTNYREVEVYPESIGQFTGLHDKNGKEIYEGDIIKIHEGNYPLNWVVDYDLKYGSYFLYWKRNKDADPHTRNITDIHKFEIIGNLYENPSLLNG